MFENCLAALEGGVPASVWSVVSSASRHKGSSVNGWKLFCKDNLSAWSVIEKKQTPLYFRIQINRRNEVIIWLEQNVLTRLNW